MARSSSSRGSRPGPRAAVSTAPRARALPWADALRPGMRWAIIALFVAVTLPVLVWKHPVGDYFTETDFYGGYAPGVHALWAHGLDPSRYGVVGPVYELLLGLLGLSGLDLFRLAQALSLGSIVATIVLWSGWLEGRFGRGVGWIAALLMATNPTVFRYAYTASTDAPYLALVSAAFVLLFSARPRLRTLALGGALAALATLTRYTGIVLVGLGLLAPFLPGESAPWQGRRLRALACVLAGVAVVFGPWWLFTLTHGAPPTLRFYHNLAYEVYARARGITWDDYQRTLEQDFPTFQSVLTRDPGAVLSRLVANTGEHLAQAAQELWLWPLSVLALAGLVAVVVRRARGAAPLLAYAALVYVSLVPVFFADRYHLPLVPAAAGLGALALAGPYAWLAGARAPRGLATALGVACLAVAAFVAARASVADAQWVASQVPAEIPSIARALKADWRGSTPPRVIARKPHLAYYADATPVAFVALSDLPALARYAHAQHADYLFVSWPEAELRPPFAFLLVPEFAPPGLTPVAAAPSGHMVLYRVHPEFGQVLPVWYPREWEWRAAEGMTRITPSDPEMWLRTAEGRHARRDLAGATDAIGLALRLRPGWGDAYLELGNLEADQGDDAAAIQDFDRAVTGGATSPRLFLSYAVVLHRAGQDARANQMMQRYVALTHDTRFEGLAGAPPPGAPAR